MQKGSVPLKYWLLLPLLLLEHGVTSNNSSTPANTRSGGTPNGTSTPANTGSGGTPNGTSTPANTGSGGTPNGTSTPANTGSGGTPNGTSTPANTGSGGTPNGTSTPANTGSGGTPNGTSTPANTGSGGTMGGSGTPSPTATHTTPNRMSTSSAISTSKVRPDGSLQPWEIFLITLASVLVAVGFFAGVFFCMRNSLSLRDAFEAAIYRPHGPHLGPGPGGSHGAHYRSRWSPNWLWRSPVPLAAMEMRGSYHGP